MKPTIDGMAPGSASSRGTDRPPRVKPRNSRSFRKVWYSQLEQTFSLLQLRAMMYGPAVRRKMKLAD
jgi:hypothetical protein